ncbi:cytosol aminopeptidase [Campylobacterota bacterium]|nr:cytosol aminopeptidase [Campylobacterota bacterium]
MRLEFIKGKADADFRVIFTIKKEMKHKFVGGLPLLEKLNFDGENETSALLAERGELYIGIEDADDLEGFRIAAAKAVKILKGLKIKSAAFDSYDKIGAETAKAIAFGVLLGAYEFTLYKSKPKEVTLSEIYFTNENYYDAETDEAAVKEALEYAKVVSNGVNYARDLVNRSPDEMTPSALAHAAQEAADDLGFECEIYDEEFLESSKMGAFLAVSRASAHPPRLIYLRYAPKNPQKKIAIVGKGLTYDSGGLSLKPADYMTTMKADMGGGAAVIAIVKTASMLNLPIEIHAVIGATENMIGGDAYKPDDILRAKNGKTIEVKNTDAEGRLVLSDCLCFAQEKGGKDGEIDYLLDIATLTGACVVALGEYTSGVMGFDEPLKDALVKAADESGELAAKLPFNRHLKKLIKSDVADISNAAPVRYGGAITAALFLSEFVEEANRSKWAHLDIAGPCFVEKAWGVNPIGASGAAVRWIVGFLEKIAADGGGSGSEQG